MKTRIKFVGYVDVYGSPDDPESWVEGALTYGDKHADRHSSWLGKIVSVEEVGDDD
ncbi:hypothetical protein ACFVZM_06575 [Streptomyces sioyaensis]|uniref:hypothetical protein n=1 Tax=Streptomyces sioyaensis TaxID=67364 RepID=UPI0036A6D695